MPLPQGESSIIWKIIMELVNNENNKLFAVCLQKSSSSFSGLSAIGFSLHLMFYFSIKIFVYICHICLQNIVKTDQFSHFQALIMLIQVQYSIHLEMSSNLKTFPNLKKHFAGSIFS